MRLRPGWVPQDVPDRRQSIDASRQLLWYAKYSGPGGSPQLVHGLTVTVYAAGVTPDEHRLGDHPTGQRPSANQGEGGRPPGPGPSIGGQPSTWSGRARLMWQWAPTAWAAVNASGYGSLDEARAVAHRFAAALRIDGDEAVRMPFTMARPPAPLRLIGTHLSWSVEDGPQGQLVLSDRDDATDPTTGFPRQLVVSVERSADTAGNPKAGRPNTTLGGHRALVDFAGDAGRATMFDVRGHRQTVHVFDAATARHVDRAKAIALCESIRGIADPEQWTATPFS